MDKFDTGREWFLGRTGRSLPLIHVQAWKKDKEDQWKERLVAELV